MEYLNGMSPLGGNQWTTVSQILCKRIFFPTKTTLFVQVSLDNQRSEFLLKEWNYLRNTYHLFPSSGLFIDSRFSQDFSNIKKMEKQSYLSEILFRSSIRRQSRKRSGLLISYWSVILPNKSPCIMKVFIVLYSEA